MELNFIKKHALKRKVQENVKPCPISGRETRLYNYWTIRKRRANILQTKVSS